MNYGEKLVSQLIYDIVMAKMGHPEQIHESKPGQDTYLVLRNHHDSIICTDRIKVQHEGQLKEGFRLRQVVIIKLDLMESFTRITEDRDFSQG